MKIKLNMTPEKMCQDQAALLLPFIQEASSYEFDEEPNYSKLKHLLSLILLDQNIVPDLKHDWSKFKLS
jgi:hypothetical protein